jgi:siderophore synthetase component
VSCAGSQSNNDLPGANPVVAKINPMPIVISNVAESAVFAKIIDNKEKYNFSQVLDKQMRLIQIQDGTYSLGIMTSDDAASLYKDSEGRIKVVASISRDYKWLVVVNTNYLKNYAAIVIEAMQDISASIDWMYSNQDELYKLVDREKITTKKALQSKIKLKEFAYTEGEKVKANLNKYYKKNLSKKDIPKDDFYYIRK